MAEYVNRHGEVEWKPENGRLDRAAAGGAT